MIAIGTRVRIRPECRYLIQSHIMTGLVQDRRGVRRFFSWKSWCDATTACSMSTECPVLRILRDGQTRSEEWSENMWEPDL